MEYNGQIDPNLYTFLLTGIIGKAANLIEKPMVGWMTESCWNDICGLSEFEGNFDKIHLKFNDYREDWTRIYNSFEPWKEPFPEPYEATMSDFERILMMKFIRPDKMIPQMMEFIIKTIGQKFVDIPALSLEKVFTDSHYSTPLIFVLTAGVDAFHMLDSFARKQDIELEGISLGQGQGPTALRLISNSAEKGQWVVLQNCHLSEKFMPDLEKRCDELLTEKNVHPNFRLWLTSYSCPFFPTSILQNGIKMTNEPPSGLKNNLITAFSLDVAADPNIFEGCEKKKEFKRMLFGLAFFHSVIIERRRFGPLGWNNKYDFTENDLRISVLQLKDFLDKGDEIPFEALWYLTAECNYGGKVTDARDRTCLLTTLKTFYTNDLVIDLDHRFLPSSDLYKVPKEDSYQDFMEYINNLPLTTDPEVFGFHSNASITKEINETKQMIQALVEIRGSGSGGGSSGNERIIKFIEEILENFPQKYDLKAAREKNPPSRENSMNTVLLQELSRFNIMISVIRASLQDLKQALAGLIVFSFELESVMTQMELGKVPTEWLKYSYPSLKGLTPYLKDFTARINFFRDWVEQGSPMRFWGSGFFFIQGFLTAVLQNYARKYTIAIDKLDFDFVCMNVNIPVEEAPEDGAIIYGLFLEGAKFDYDKMLLAESDPKILFTKCPPV